MQIFQSDHCNNPWSWQRQMVIQVHRAQINHFVQMFHKQSCYCLPPILPFQWIKCNDNDKTDSGWSQVDISICLPSRSVYSGTLQRCGYVILLEPCVTIVNPSSQAPWRVEGREGSSAVGGCCDYVKKLGYYLNIYLDVWPVFSPFHGSENCCQTASVFSAQWRFCPRVHLT